MNPRVVKLMLTSLKRIKGEIPFKEFIVQVVRVMYNYVSELSIGTKN